MLRSVILFTWSIKVRLPNSGSGAEALWNEVQDKCPCCIKKTWLPLCMFLMFQKIQSVFNQNSFQSCSFRMFSHLSRLVARCREMSRDVARLTADSVALLHCGRRPPPHPRKPRPAGGQKTGQGMQANGEEKIASCCFVLFACFNLWLFSLVMSCGFRL